MSRDAASRQQHGVRVKHQHQDHGDEAHHGLGIVGAEQLGFGSYAGAVRQQLQHGSRPESSVRAAAEAAAIPERSLIAAADALGVRTQRGQWWLPG